MAFDELKNNGVTSSTPNKILLGAGTIHKGLSLGTGGAWNFSESLIGATAGGNKITISAETVTVTPDGAFVKVKGMDFKVGETATLEVNLLELTKSNLILMTGGEVNASSSYTAYDEIVSKGKIESGDYIENLAFVGKTTDGKSIIVIFDNARCTSGLQIDGKAKENSTFPATFECYSDTSNVEKLPWHILVEK